MTSERERWARIGRLFEEALDLDPEDRAAFVERRCGADRRVASEVLELLAAHDTAGWLDRVAARWGGIDESGA